LGLLLPLIRGRLGGGIAANSVLYVIWPNNR